MPSNNPRPHQIASRAHQLKSAVRADPKLGKGSCSTYDECYTDDELLEYCHDQVVTYPHLTLDDHLAKLHKLEAFYWEHQREIGAL